MRRVGLAVPLIRTGYLGEQLRAKNGMDHTAISKNDRMGQQMRLHKLNIPYRRRGLIASKADALAPGHECGK